MQRDEIEYMIKNGFVRDEVDGNHYIVVSAFDQARGSRTSSMRSENTKYLVKVSDFLASLPFCDITLEQKESYELVDEVNFITAGDELNVDVILPGRLELTGGTVIGLYNTVYEESFNPGQSPVGTLWNSFYTDSERNGWSDLSDLSDRTYDTWLDAVGGDPTLSIGVEMIMRDTEYGNYYLVMFTAWDEDPEGIMSYTRRRIQFIEPCKLTFSDGSVQTSAAGTPISSNESVTINRQIDGNGRVTFDLSVEGEAVLYSNVAIVDPTHGNDDTAVLGDFAKTYSSIFAAASAAASIVSGDQRALVYIRQGVYSTQINLSDGVDFYCEPGVVFIGSSQVQDAGIAVVSNFYGYARFVNQVTHALLITAGSTVNFQFDVIDNVFGQCIRLEPALGQECNVLIEGNSIFGTTVGVGYAIALRRNANAIFNIRKFIKADHSVIDIRTAFEGQIVINTPQLILSDVNLYGGAFKQAIIVYDATAASKITVNGDIISEMTTYLGGVPGMISTLGGAGSIEVNGNIRATENHGLYIFSAHKVRVKGDISSSITPVVISSSSQCYIQDGLVSGEETSIVTVSENAQMSMSNSFLYNAQEDGNLIALSASSIELSLYNVVGESAGDTGFTVVSSAAATDVRLHNVRSNKPLDTNIVDLLTPTGFIEDPLITVPKF